MRRVVSVWFPHWPTDRLHRHRSKPQDKEAPLVTALDDGRRRVIAAVDGAAARMSLRPGMAIAHALARVPQLEVEEAEPEADAGALHRLALWCHRYTPLASTCPPDGLWLEIAGTAHLFGGEVALMSHLLARLARDGINARAAVADTPGAAHALARHGADSMVLVGPGEHLNAVAPLPVACLRLEPEMDATLRRLGFEQVGHLERIPRALLARRFGRLVGQRLDQMEGVQHESLVPLLPDRELHRRETFLDPLLTAEALSIAITRLVAPLCKEMESRGLGARRLDLLFERVDRRLIALRVGTVRPSRDAGHLMRLLVERLDTVEPGLGIEAMQLIVPLAEPLHWEQQESGAGPQQIARLVDRLSHRLGHERVYRAAPVETLLPEQVVRKEPPFEPAGRQPAWHGPPLVPTLPDHGSMAEVPQRAELILKLVATTAEPVAAEATCPTGRSWPGPPVLTLVPSPDLVSGSDLAEPETGFVLPWKPRPEKCGQIVRSIGRGHLAWPNHLKPPARLLAPPCPVVAMTALPGKTLVAFTWRRRYRVFRAEGPERVHEVWWQGGRETDDVRDYFQVEVEGGQRFWLFRRGSGIDPCIGELAWFLHGLF